MRRNKLSTDLRDSYIVVFLIIWLCMLFRPFAPLLSDAYEHTFNSGEHHAHMHQLGINHTDAQVSKMMDETKGKDKTQTLASSVENPFVFFTEPEKQNFFEEMQIFAFRFSVISMQNYFANIQSPPPEAA